MKPLTTAEARKQMIGEIEAKYSNRARLADLAAEYMQSVNQIKRWVQDEHRRMAETADPFLGLSPEQVADWSRSKLANLRPKRALPLSDDGRAIAAEYAAGPLSQRALAAKHGISHQQLRTILSKAEVL